MSNTAKRLIAAASTLVIMAAGFSWVLSCLGLQISNANIVEEVEQTVRTRTDEDIAEVLNARDIKMTLMNEDKGEIAEMQFGLDLRLENVEFTEYSVAVHPNKFKKLVDYIIINGENYYLSDPSSDDIGELAYNAIHADAALEYK